MNPLSVREKVRARARRLAETYGRDAPSDLLLGERVLDPIERLLNDPTSQSGDINHPFESPYIDKNGVCYANPKHHLKTLYKVRPRVMLTP